MEGIVRQEPAAAAKTIIPAIGNAKPKLRYLVGKDAERLIEANEKLFCIYIMM